MTYQICNRCIMDTSDPNISFNDEGICDYCQNYENNIVPSWHTDEKGYQELLPTIEKIKKEGEGKPFDCIIGLSGGLDSSYCAYIAKEKLGLRPLLFHVDAGWNTDQAVHNIECLVDGLESELYTEVINWEEMKSLQLAFLKSQIADQDLPQDAAFFCALYKFARKHKIKYVLTGGNLSTECVREPEEWGGFPGVDLTLINDINKQFGARKLKTFPLVDVLSYKIIYRYFYGMKVVKPLNHFPYIKADAEKELNEKFGWKKFLHKHHESRFTRFYEDYWMPRKFGFEKRRAHYSSLIMTGQLDREDALQRIKKPLIDELFFEREFEFVANKLGISTNELQSIFEGENKTFLDYKSKYKLIRLGSTIMQKLGLDKRYFR